MGELLLESYGKINLSLDVLHKRDDGYHEINTIMQQIDLKDRIILRDRKNGIRIECNDENLPLNQNNLVYKAWEKLSKEMNIDKGVHIILDKKIPIAGGLAGGSSNAATVLKGLNHLWNLNLSNEELSKIGVEIGADVPFCIMGGTAHATGIGEKLTKLKKFSNRMVLLANIGIPISTAFVYENLKLDNRGTRIDIEKMAQHIEDEDLFGVASNMENIMEKIVIKKYPIVDRIKKVMIEQGALGSIMSGSGPTVFGLFDDEKKLYKCKDELEGKVAKLYVARTV